MHFLRKVSLFLALGFVSLGIALAADFPNDLSIAGDELVLQPGGGLVHNQVLKIYTTVRNNGDKDLIGTVKFFLDGNQIATDQPVSVKQGSVPDEVFINWKAVAGSHTISAQIFPYESAGDNPGNNFAQKSVFVDWDTDGDGIGNSIDTDDDNDGLSDEDEDINGTDSLKSDTDGDGVKDGEDVFPIDPTEWADNDKDGIGDNADTDDDNDGLPDEAEGTIGTDPLNPDTDGDGVQSCNDLMDKFPLDVAECLDTDGDGVGDNADAFPNDPKEWEDCDNDGKGNNADKDDDNDGTLDAEDAFPCDANELADCDADGIGDNADEDDDNDGHTDSEDVFVCDPNEWADSDGDGLGDNADPNDENHGPVVVFGGDRTVIINQEVVFDASQSSDPDGTLASFTWDFGDGSPVAEGSQTVHTYTSIGEFILTLIVTDDAGEDRVNEAIIMVENSKWLEQVLYWLMIFLLLLFVYIFYKTVKKKRQNNVNK